MIPAKIMAESNGYGQYGKQKVSPYVVPITANNSLYAVLLSLEPSHGNHPNGIGASLGRCNTSPIGKPISELFNTGIVGSDNLDMTIIIVQSIKQSKR